MTASSIIFAMKIVQVTSEAKARPIITPLTTTSADMNIDHGESSRGTVSADFAADALSATKAAEPEDDRSVEAEGPAAAGGVAAGGADGSAG